MLLLRAVAGSRLYGTNRPDSDWDWYEVHDQIRTRQTIQDSQDTIRIGLSHWIRLCEKGTHQALDAMWCPPRLTEVDKITAFRLSFRPDPYRVYDQLMRTAHAMRGIPDKVKHTHRLEFYADQVLKRGWFDPSEWGRRVQNA